MPNRGSGTPHSMSVQNKQAIGWNDTWLSFVDGISKQSSVSSYFLLFRQGPIPLTIFIHNLNSTDNLLLYSHAYWSERFEKCHIPRQHSCSVMCKIADWLFWHIMHGRKTRWFPSTLNNDGKRSRNGFFAVNKFNTIHVWLVIQPGTTCSSVTQINVSNITLQNQRRVNFTKIYGHMWRDIIIHRLQTLLK